MGGFFLIFVGNLWYNKLSASSVRKEVDLMTLVTSFVISVAASVAGYYICKWLDRK